MKPLFLKVATNPIHSFSVRQDTLPGTNSRWHYHPEIELLHIEAGSGMQFVGDHIKRFKSGDVILIGAGLPHYWRYDDMYFHDTQNKTKATVTHFHENFWGEQFLSLPENKSIKSILEKSKRGILIDNKTGYEVGLLLVKMLHTEGTERIIALMQALLLIANSGELTYLSSIGFQFDFEESENDRINNIYEYSLAHYKNKIALDEIAAIANISPNSFCRYFKSRTRKTYSKFLIEIRVGHACKLLIENRLNIQQICFESGFNNFANFHKYFKIITGKSPLQYQKEYINHKTSPLVHIGQ